MGLILIYKNESELTFVDKIVEYSAKKIPKSKIRSKGVFGIIEGSEQFFRELGFYYGTGIEETERFFKFNTSFMEEYFYLHKDMYKLHKFFNFSTYYLDCVYFWYSEKVKTEEELEEYIRKFSDPRYKIIGKGFEDLKKLYLKNMRENYPVTIKLEKENPWELL